MAKSIQVFETVEELNQKAAELMAEQARSAIAERGKFTIALSGGSAVAAPYTLFSKEPDIDWSKVYIFWGDDRFVEPTNPYSNFGLGKRSLIDQQPAIPEANVFPIPFNGLTPSDGAARYSEIIRNFFGTPADQLPVFDLLQLGMGPDGHTASLFPHSAAVHVTDQIVTFNHAGLAPWVDRLTFTFPLINNARLALFFASGGDKAERLQQILELTEDHILRPAGAVNPHNGQLVWLIDRAIAARLNL